MKLTSGDWSLTLDPQRGGMIRTLTRKDVDILRPMPEGSVEPLESASFPLAPYVNRIAHGRFLWEGQAHALAPNHTAIAHPIHGTAWLEEWRVRDQRPDRAILVHAHGADSAWPWSYALEQTLALDGNGVRATLSLTNTDSRAMPAGLGFHPWFARDKVSGIQFEAKSVWLADSDMLPTGEASADALGDWSALAPLERPHLVDNCFTGWNGALRIARSDGDLLLESPGTPFLHLFIPQEGDFFCAEPQTTMPDAVHHAPVTALQPGATQTLAMTIRSA